MTASKNGRNGSSLTAVALSAPAPAAVSSTGPRQQADAPTAASVDAASVFIAASLSTFRSPGSTARSSATGLGRTGQHSIAGAKVVRERVAKLMHLFESALEIGQLRAEQIAHLPTAFHPTLVLIADQLPYLLKAESKRLRLFDEAQPFEHPGRIDPKAARRSPGRREQSKTFVVAQRVGVRPLRAASSPIWNERSMAVTRRPPRPAAVTCQRA